MPNIATVLKDEIARIARKELRSETEKLKKVSAQHRSDIAALKRRVAELERQASAIGKKAAKVATTSTATDTSTKARYSAKSLISQRKRLGLSAADVGTLIGVTAQTIYNWESGSTHPRDEQKTAIAALRGLGKLDVIARLSELRSA